MITGYITLVLVILVLGNMLGRKRKQDKVHRILYKIHKPLGIATMLVAILHLVLTISVWKTRADAVVVTGIVAFGICIIEFLIYLKRMDWKRAWIRYHRMGAFVLVVAVVSHIATYFIDFGQYQEKIRTVQVDGMSADGIADGTYQGDYDAGYIKVSVEVIVNQGKIESIQLLKHDNEHGKKAEVIVEEVISKQTTNVDAISGATNSSQAILKAIENALSMAR